MPRRRASSSERVTLSMPPTRSDRVGLSIRFSSVLPWAVPTCPFAELTALGWFMCQTPIYPVPAQAWPLVVYSANLLSMVFSKVIFSAIKSSASMSTLW